MKRTAIIALFAAFALVATPLWTTGASAEMLDDTGTVEITAEKIHLNIVFIGSYDADGQEIAEYVLVAIFKDGSDGKTQMFWRAFPVKWEAPTLSANYGFYCLPEVDDEVAVAFGLYGVEDFLSDGIIHLDLLESGGWMKIMKSVGYRDDMMKDYDGGDGILAENNHEIHGIVLVDGLRSNLYPFTIQGDDGTPIIEWTFQDPGIKESVTGEDGGDEEILADKNHEIHDLEFAEGILVIIFGEDGFVTILVHSNSEMLNDYFQLDAIWRDVTEGWTK